MSNGPAFLEFVLLPSFERATKDVLTDANLHRLQLALIANPTVGGAMVGTGGVRKVRVALGGRGKSGGLRVIYFYRSAKGRIYLITTYAKADQDNLSDAQKNAMKALTARLDSED